MAFLSREPREYWLKSRFSKNEVANSGYTKAVCSRQALMHVWGTTVSAALTGKIAILAVAGSPKR